MHYILVALQIPKERMTPRPSPEALAVLFPPAEFNVGLGTTRVPNELQGTLRVVAGRTQDVAGFRKDPGGTKRLVQLDGLRGVAMIAVFLGHFGSMWSEVVHPTGYVNYFLRLVEADATFGSSFFMLLSGFFAYGSLMRGEKNFTEFLRGRIRRLYPLYLIMTVVYVVGSLVFPSISKLPSNKYQAGIFILETAFLLPGVLPIHPLMDVAWTLSFVVLFYFFAGSLASLFRLTLVAPRVRIGILLALEILWAWAAYFTAWWEVRTTIFWVGFMLSEAVTNLWTDRKHWAVQITAPAVAIAVIGICLRTSLMLSQPHTLILPLLVWRLVITSVTLSALVWVACFGPEWWKRLLSGTRLSHLGTISYSFYLTHGFALKAFRFMIIPWLGQTARAPLVFLISQVIALAISIKTASVVYSLLEKDAVTLKYLASLAIPWRVMSARIGST